MRIRQAAPGRPRPSGRPAHCSGAQKSRACQASAGCEPEVVQHAGPQPIARSRTSRIILSISALLSATVDRERGAARRAARARRVRPPCAAPSASVRPRRAARATDSSAPPPGSARAGSTAGASPVRPARVRACCSSDRRSSTPDAETAAMATARSQRQAGREHRRQVLVQLALPRRRPLRAVRSGSRC